MAYEIGHGKTAIHSTPFNTLMGYVILVISGVYAREATSRCVAIIVRTFLRMHMGFSTKAESTNRELRNSRHGDVRASVGGFDAVGLDFFIEKAKKAHWSMGLQLEYSADSVRVRRSCV